MTDWGNTNTQLEGQIMYKEKTQGRKIITGAVGYFGDFFLKEFPEKLSEAQKKYITDCQNSDDPNGFSDFETLGEIYDLATDDEIFSRVGREWGSALVAQWEEMGLKTPVEIAQALCGLYVAHHRMADDSSIPEGELRVEPEGGDQSFILHIDTPHPFSFIWNAYAETISQRCAVRVNVEVVASEKAVRISW